MRAAWLNVTAACMLRLNLEACCKVGRLAHDPAFLPALTLPAPEHIHAEGGLESWQEAARLPCDPPPPEAPELTAGEPNQLQPSKATPQAQKRALKRVPLVLTQYRTGYDPRVSAYTAIVASAFECRLEMAMTAFSRGSHRGCSASQPCRSERTAPRYPRVKSSSS